mmetsp:Transcript_18547/g.16139  ORF Transcript_18547/g.16139 Transcript_18547/m.16139 type:complete len:169 (-) Transcript_18547:800-1306(-)|eukprot:CAMPEP_0114583738 /NCGR_PEP_ID=MMETSP0125-20121206/7434_1 /TAXON_ID=485358 ORGANISM="Aristerostoma sp., Strain ATCC 50986" /NCGR_SAMPLE_ID=MMETSP0125 /ASSEMBLY_ACC=CAM_ASM_000245 /LENGTH=168 /DNA_ID=CAMNT_0001777421 /DNA_START=305 /DNA_END=811 /DNA_ORIENTATION=+
MTHLRIKILNSSIKVHNLNTIAQSFKSLKNLKDLKLDVIYENPGGIKEFVLEKALKSLTPTLKNLSLNFGWGGKFDLPKICNALRKQTQLQEFTFIGTETGLFGEGIRRLASAVAQMKDLNYLRFEVANNSFNINSFVKIYESIAELANLRKLIINTGKNMITADNLQ